MVKKSVPTEKHLRLVHTLSIIKLLSSNASVNDTTVRQCMNRLRDIHAETVAVLEGDDE